MRIWAIGFLTLFAVAAFSEGKVIFLNGKTLSGKIVSVNDSVLVFESPSGKRSQWKRTEIKSFQKGERGLASEGTLTEQVKTHTKVDFPRYLGLITGPTVSNLSGSSSAGGSSGPLSSQTGVVLGVTCELMPLWKFLYLQPELLYEELGASYSNASFIDNISYNILRIPVLVKAKGELIPGSPVQFVGFAGPSFGFALSSSASLSGTIDGQTVNASTGANTNFFDLGFELGGGVEWTVKKDILLLGNLRYDLGLTNIVSDGSGTLHTRDLQFLVGAGYHF